MVYNGNGRNERRAARAAAALVAGVAGLSLVVACSSRTVTHAGPDEDAPRPTIVLEHGAFADGSSWNEVIAKLSKDRYPVVAAANPLRGPGSDAAALRSVISHIDGPVILVGHSYGGSVISAAAAGNDKVKGLVYVAAFLPAPGETALELTNKYPGSTLPGTLNPVPFTRTEPTEPALLEILSPHDRSLIGRAAQAQPADVDRAVEAAHTSFESRVWRDVAPVERIAVLRRFNELREEQADRIAELITAENGSAAWFTKAGQAGLTRQANAYLTAAEHFDWERTLTPSDPNAKVRSVVRREPVGVVAAVIPWNSPFSSATSKILPALLTGNSVVLKVSPENSLSMGVLAELVDRIGLPDGVISVLPAERETSEHLISHPRVDKIAFTGSTGAGRRIATIAGEQLKRVSLELGGKSAAVILPDADLSAVMNGLKFGSLLNNGESCIAQTRILAPRARYEEVVAALAALVESLPVGDPHDPATFIGPMVRGDQQQRVRDYIAIGIGEGARLACGGPQLPPGLRDGFYVTPTVFADVTPDMRIAREEIFGPVLAVLAYDDIDDAIRIANDSDYGLSGGVWSADEAAAVAVARRIRTGTVTINGAPVGFDGPFGGFKASGIGREFGAVGLGQYTEYQTITV